GIDPIQNIELNVRFGGCLQAQTHRAAVSVKPAADVLDIKDERIKAFELFRRGFVSLAIEAVNRQSGYFVDTVGDCLIPCAANAMFGTEQGGQRHIRSVLEQVNRRLPLPIVASLVGDQANPLPFEWREMILHEHIDAVEHAVWFGAFAMGWFGGITGFVDWLR